MTTQKPQRKSKFTCLVVPAATSGIVSGIFSVITVYFFKPVWERLMRVVYNERKVD